MPKRYIDPYLTGFVSKPEEHFELNGHKKCPKCKTGLIISDLRDKLCLNCGLREIITVDIITWYEDETIQWLIRNRSRELFATFDFLSQNIIGEETKCLKIPSYKGIITPQVESILLKLAALEQRGVIRIHSHGVISDYENVIVVYDVIDKTINKRLAPVGVL